MLVVGVHRGQRVVMGSCAKAHALGVRRGVSLAHARALVGTAREVEHDPRADALGLAALARWAGARWSPLVAVDGDDGLMLDVTGCAHLFGGEAAMADAIAKAIARMGLTGRVALAGTPGCAWALARYGRDADDTPRRALIARSGQEREVLATLPVEALRIEPQAADALAQVGVDRVGQVMDLPRCAVPARYGAMVLRRLDQALGLVAEPVARTSEDAPVEACRELPGGVSRGEDLCAVVRALVDEACASLERLGSGTRRLEVRLTRLGLPEAVISAELSRATRRAAHLWSLLRPRVERVHMGFGVERAAVLCRPDARVAHAQRVLSLARGGLALSPASGSALNAAGGLMLAPDAHERDEHRRDVGALIDTLTNRLGRSRLWRPTCRAGHRPERAHGRAPAEEVVSESSATRDRAAATAGAALGVAAGVSSSIARPSVVFDPPRAARAIALTPDGPVARLAYDGEDVGVCATVGPERISGEWWRTREETRDYYRVCAEGGRWLWVYREVGTGEWRVHGVWA